MIKISTNKKDLFIIRNQKDISFFNDNTITDSIFKSEINKTVSSVESFEMKLSDLKANSIFSVIIVDYDKALLNEKCDVDLEDVVVTIELPTKTFDIKIKEVLDLTDGIQHYCNSIWLCDINISVSKLKNTY